MDLRLRPFAAGALVCLLAAVPAAAQDPPRPPSLKTVPVPEPANLLREVLVDK